MAVYEFCLAVADEYGRKHIHRHMLQFAQCHDRRVFSLPANVTDQAGRDGSILVPQDDGTGLLEIIGPLVACTGR